MLRLSTKCLPKFGWIQRDMTIYMNTKSTKYTAAGAKMSVGSQATSTFTPAESMDKIECISSKPMKEQGMPEFHNVKVAFKGKSTPELFRAYTVLTLCSFDRLVDNHAKLLKWSRKLLGKSLFRAMMKATIYGQFEGGETPHQVQTTAKKMISNGVIPMFAYTAAEVHGIKNDPSGQKLLEDSWRKNYDAILNGLDIAAGMKAVSDIKPKLTGKVTFLTSADILRHFTDVINWNEKTILDVVSRMDRRETAELVEHLRELSLGVDTNLPLPSVDPNSGSLLYMVNARLTIYKATELNRVYQTCHSGLKIAREISDYLNKDKIPEFDNGQRSQLFWAVNKMREISQRAAEMGVTWVIDAEQTYLQPAIDAITLDLKRQFNKNEAAILNTYQCYLKRTLNIVKRDLKLAKDEGFCFGGKIVRGAYMEEERRLAKDLGYEDPVNPTFQATSDMYHNVAFELLNEVCSSSPGQLSVIFGTHNEETVKLILQQCYERNVRLDGKNLMFAQVIGLRDYMAYSMGHKGLPGGKLIHYGDIEEGVAYLSRRLMENRRGMPSADLERKMIGRELRRRIMRV